MDHSSITPAGPADKKSITVAATGHRPQRLGLDYSPHSNFLLTRFATRKLADLKEKCEIRRIISGFAQGWDLAVAHAAVTLKIPLVAALPFDGHGGNWPGAGRRRHDALLAEAGEVVVVTPGGYRGREDAWKYIERDHYMCDRAKAEGGVLFALFDGAEKGGTWSTVEYGEAVGLKVVNTYRDWPG